MQGLSGKGSRDKCPCENGLSDLFHVSPVLLAGTSDQHTSQISCAKNQGQLCFILDSAELVIHEDCI